MGNKGAGFGGAVENGGDSSRVCWHIRPFAIGYLDGTLSGIIRLFVREHVARCRSCQKALAALRAIGDRLQALRHSPPTGAPETLETERWTALEAEWDKVEQRRSR